MIIRAASDLELDCSIGLLNRNAQFDSVDFDNLL